MDLFKGAELMLNLFRYILFTFSNYNIYKTRVIFITLQNLSWNKSSPKISPKFLLYVNNTNIDSN